MKTKQNKQELTIDIFYLIDDMIDQSKAKYKSSRVGARKCLKKRNVYRF